MNRLPQSVFQSSILGKQSFEAISCPLIFPRKAVARRDVRLRGERLSRVTSRLVTIFASGHYFRLVTILLYVSRCLTFSSCSHRRVDPCDRLFYLADPERIMGSFGLKPPASDADTRAWLRLKGTRDVASGLVVLTMMLAANSRTVGIVLLVLAIIPFWRHVQYSAGGSKSKAVSVHGVTCAVMSVVGLLLIHAK